MNFYDPSRLRPAHPVSSSPIASGQRPMPSSLPPSNYNNLTEHGFFGGELQVLQGQDGLRSGTDACLLAASVGLPQTGRIARELRSRAPQLLEVGTGTGAVSLMVAWRLGTVEITGVEINSLWVNTAKQNALRNGLADRVSFQQGDLLNLPNLPPKTRECLGKLGNPTYDVIFSNPPWNLASKGPTSPKAQRSLAMTEAPSANHLNNPSVGDPENSRGEESGTSIQQWLKSMSKLLRSGGLLHMIHRADRLTDLLRALPSDLGNLHILPLHPYAGQDAHRVLIRTRKNDRSKPKLLTGRTIHQANGTFEPWVEELCRLGGELPWQTTR